MADALDTMLVSGLKARLREEREREKNGEPRLNANERKLIDTYRALPKSDREALLKQAEQWVLLLQNRKR